MPRPATILVFGILNLVFGVLGLCSPLSLVTLFIDIPGQPPNPVNDLMRSDPVLWTWIVSTSVLGFLMSVALIAAGIALIREKAWGRSVSIVYGWVSLVFIVVNAVVLTFWMAIPLLQGMSDNPTPDEIGGIVGGIGGGAAGVCFGFIYPVLLLIFMYRRSVREFFAEQDDGPLQGAFRIEE